MGKESSNCMQSAENARVLKDDKETRREKKEQQAKGIIAYDEVRWDERTK